MRRPLAERFWEKVDKRGPDDCWLWTASLRNGYGQIYDGEDWREPKALYAHRVSYEIHVGPIPDGMQLDHTCHTADKECRAAMDCPHRRCVNPAHLEPVTVAENLARGRGFGQRTYKPRENCIHGHPLEGDNLYVAPDGHRVCIACRRAREKRRYWRLKHTPNC